MFVAVSVAGSFGFAFGAPHESAPQINTRNGTDRERGVRIGRIVVHASGGADADRGEVADLAAQELLQACHEARLGLPHRLARRPEAIADRLEGDRIVREEALVEDRALALSEIDAEARDRRLDLLLELAPRNLLLDGRPGRREDIPLGAVFGTGERRVDPHVARA